MGTNVIRFCLNNKWIVENDIDPNQTALSYLRTKMAQLSVKEGCAGGDCGACSILIGEANSLGQVEYMAMNACIALLGSLDGKYVITTEGLTDGEQLHPVQAAMVEYHGSQCGFCTPGIVTSLAALYHNKNGAKPSEHEIHVALSGNLCRCTGYRPIIEAAENMNKFAAPSKTAVINSTVVEHFDPAAPKEGEKPSIEKDGRKLFIPNNESELQAILAANPDAVLWAGGTDLGLELTQQYKQFDSLVSLHKINSLTEVSENDDSIRFGAMVTLSNAESYLDRQFPSFAQMLERFASRQIRNLGTLGGNVANGSPIGDTPPVFFALDARVEIASAKGTREIGVESFFKGYKQTDLQPGEYLKSIVVPKLTATQTLQVFKVSKRKEDDISAVLMAVRLDTDGSKVTEARIACGGMAATPLRATNTEKALVGKSLTMESFENASKEIQNDYTPIKDVRATAEYRLNVAANLVIKSGLEITATNGGK